MTGSSRILLAALVSLCVASAHAQNHEDGGELGAKVCAAATEDKWHFPHPDDCSKFIKCVVGSNLSSIVQCPPGLLYNDADEVCDYPANVNCGSGSVAPPQTTTTTTVAPPSTSTPSETSTRSPSTSTPAPAPTTTTPSSATKPSTGDPGNEFNRLCEPLGPHAYHVAHPTDPTKFYKCDWTVRKAYEFDCPNGLVFDQAIQTCTYRN